MRDILLKYTMKWFADIALNSEDNEPIVDILNQIRKFKKPYIYSYEKVMLNKKLSNIKDKFEMYVTLPEDRHLLADRNNNVRTIRYSSSLLAIQFLDELLNQSRDSTTRIKLGHIDTGTILQEIEDNHNELAINSYKIFSELIKEM
jgi:hypothetical protein